MNDQNIFYNEYVYRSSDVVSWFPKVLQFVFEDQDTLRNDNATLCLIESDTASPCFKNELKASLQLSSRITDNLNEFCGAFVYICNDLEDNIEDRVKAKLRELKVHGNHVYVYASSHRESTSDDINWVATRTFTRDETMMFLLHLMTRLGLTEEGPYELNMVFKEYAL